MVCDTTAKFRNSVSFLCLNPYSIGIWSATCYVTDDAATALGVLILILLEYGLRPDGKKQEVYFCECLNPYSIGIWSATQQHEFRGPP